jgi:hypothetical protein
MFQQIKENIFTIHGLITTIIHVFLVVGFVTCWITMQVKVFDNDPAKFLQPQTAPKEKK